jgi:hypothetical protein
VAPEKHFNVFVATCFSPFQRKLTEWCEFKVKVFYTLLAMSIIQVPEIR